jgi:hypothetical protein
VRILEYIKKTSPEKSGKSKTFEDKEEFSIVADGTETMTDFYACLIIVDSANRDCLDENYPLKK